ncbi:MAG: hypothetical protein QXT26_07730, partial [Thermoproteota archaeon]
RGVKAVIVKGKMSHYPLEVFEEHSMPVIPAEKLNIVWVDGLPYADQEEIKRLTKNSETVKSIDTIKTLKSIVNDHLREIKGEDKI